MMSLDPKITLAIERIAQANERTAAACERIAEAIVAPGDVELTVRTPAPAPKAKRG